MNLFVIAGAVALAEFIADSPRLLRIDLRENDIKTGGLMALSLSLKVSETVTRIDLDKDPKRESVSTHFCTVFEMIICLIDETVSRG